MRGAYHWAGHFGPNPLAPSGLRSLSGHASEVAEQAGHIDRARSHKGSHQHLVHRGLQKPPEESPAKHGRDSAQESQNLFLSGFISRLRNPARFSGDEDWGRIGGACLCEERKPIGMATRRIKPKHLILFIAVLESVADEAAVITQHFRAERNKCSSVAARTRVIKVSFLVLA